MPSVDDLLRMAEEDRAETPEADRDDPALDAECFVEGYLDSLVDDEEMTRTEADALMAEVLLRLYG